MNTDEIRKGLVEILDDASNCAMIGSATRYIEAAIVALAAQRWIPVGERMPEDGVPVLTFTNTGDIGPVAWVNDRGRWKWHVDDELIVTHWRPLPDGPQAGRGEG